MSGAAPIVRAFACGILMLSALVGAVRAENLNPGTMKVQDRQALVDEIEYVRFLFVDYTIGFNWQDGFKWDPERPIVIPGHAVEWSSFGFFRGGGWRLKNHQRHADLKLRIQDEQRFLSPLGIQEPLMIFVDRLKDKIVEDKFRPNDDKQRAAIDEVTRTFRSMMALLDSAQAPYLGNGVTVTRPRSTGEGEAGEAPAAPAPVAEVPVAAAGAAPSLLGMTAMAGPSGR